MWLFLMLRFVSHGTARADASLSSMQRIQSCEWRTANGNTINRISLDIVSCSFGCSLLSSARSIRIHMFSSCDFLKQIIVIIMVIVTIVSCFSILLTVNSHGLCQGFRRSTSNQFIEISNVCTIFFIDLITFLVISKWFYWDITSVSTNPDCLS